MPVRPSANKHFTEQGRMLQISPFSRRRLTVSARTHENWAPVSIRAGIFSALNCNSTHNRGWGGAATTLLMELKIPARGQPALGPLPVSRHWSNSGAIATYVTREPTSPAPKRPSWRRGARRRPVGAGATADQRQGTVTHSLSLPCYGKFLFNQPYDHIQLLA